MNVHNESIDRLFNTILKLETLEECYDFFEDLCTIREILDMSQRLDTAVLLEEGYNYVSISQMADVSTATISRVNKCLTYGSGGYKKALERLKADD